jgi:predicted regulator of Ras-like GTPase activity (Roadblock/LC7/MglB family)
MRDDQVEQEQGANFATPFSAKAEEDAQRFKVAATPVPKPVTPLPVEVAVPAPAEVEEAVPPPAVPLTLEMPPENAKNGASANGTSEHETPPISEAEELEQTAEPEPVEKTRTALQTALDTDDELDAKTVVTHVGKLAGVEACAIMFGDGLSLAGNLPQEYEADGLCAMAPSLLQRVENHMIETKLGALRAMTLSCARAAVTFFMHDNLCLAALHTKGELAPEVRDRLACAVHELSKKYSHPA